MSESNVNTNKVRAKKMMLLFALLSITMTFAGLTSAYLVSKGRPDWLVDFQLPNLFFYSTLIIVLSSLCLLYTSPSPRDSNLSRMPSSA